MENLKDKLSKSLHKNHFLMLSLKQKLLNVYRQEITGPNPKRKIMRSMVHLCKEMFDLLEIVEPGISRLKGIFNEIIYSNHLYNGNDKKLNLNLVTLNNYIILSFNVSILYNLLI